MAVIAVGNFSDTEQIVAALKGHFDVPEAARDLPPAPIPRCAALELTCHLQVFFARDVTAASPRRRVVICCLQDTMVCSRYALE